MISPPPGLSPPSGGSGGVGSPATVAAIVKPLLSLSPNILYAEATVKV